MYFCGKIFSRIFLIREKNIAFIFVNFFNVWLNRKPFNSCICLYSPWNSPGQNTGMGSLSLLQRILPTQGSNPGLPLWVDSLPAEPQRKPSTGVGSLSLLQGIFPAQESNRGLQHRRRILYQLTYQGSPIQMNMYIQFTIPSSQLSKPLDFPEL